MPVVSKMWVHGADIGEKEPCMTVYATFKSIGDVRLEKVAIPASFKKALLDLAQAAADKKQAELQAEVLGDKAHPHYLAGGE